MRWRRDTLFEGAVGRPDLAGQEREMAALLHDTLHHRLMVMRAHPDARDSTDPIGRVFGRRKPRR